MVGEQQTGRDIVLECQFCGADRTARTSRCPGCGTMVAGTLPAPWIEFVWLIERGQSENHAPTVWWVGPNQWTSDAWCAFRFATEEAADKIIRDFSAHPAQPTARATEHGFEVRRG